MRFHPLALALMLAGCGGGDDSDTSTDTDAAVNDTDSNVSDTDDASSPDTDDSSSDDTDTSSDTDPVGDTDAAGDTDATGDTDAADDTDTTSDTDAAGDTDAGDTDTTVELGPFGKAVKFPGDSQSLYAETPIDLPVASRNYTIEFWMKPETFGPERDRLIDWRNGGTGYGHIVVDFTPAGKIQFGGEVYRGSASASLESTNAVTFGAWNHVALVIETTDTVKAVHLYVNDVVTDYAPPAGWYAGTVGGTHHLAMGGSSTMSYKGEMDNVRVWSVARTASEISDSKDLTYTTATAPSSLIDQWDFNADYASMRGNAAGEAWGTELVAR